MALMNTDFQRKKEMTEKDLECTDHQPFIKVKSADGTEHTYYSVLCEDLPEEMLQKAREEINETEGNKREGLRKLRKFMQKKKLPDIEEKLLIDVLRSCKYDIKKSKVKLVKFAKSYQTIFTNMDKYDPNEVGALVSEMGIGMFPYRDREGRVVAFCRPFLRIFSYDMELLQSAFVAAIGFGLCLPMTSLLGVGLIMDCAVPEYRLFYPIMRMFASITPHLVNIPHRVGYIKVLNEHFLGRLLYKICRPFMPNKIKKRVSFLGSGFEGLHKVLPPEVMYEEYGGYLGPMNAEVYKRKIMDALKCEIEKVKRFSTS